MAGTTKQTSADVVYAKLRADVLGGVHPPGSRLKFAELGRRYGTSISVLREALTRLVEQRIVTSEPQVGFQVFALSLDDLRDLTQTRIDLETLAVRRAVVVGDVEWESAMVASYHRLERTPMVAEGPVARISDAWEQAHASFHRSVVSGCRSARIQEITDNLRAASEIYRRWSYPGEPRRDVASEHRRILEAALSRDPDEAAAAIADHYERTRSILEHRHDSWPTVGPPPDPGRPAALDGAGPGAR